MWYYNIYKFVCSEIVENKLDKYKGLVMKDFAWDVK